MTDENRNEPPVERRECETEGCKAQATTMHILGYSSSWHCENHGRLRLAAGVS